MCMYISKASTKTLLLLLPAWSRGSTGTHWNPALADLDQAILKALATFGVYLEHSAIVGYNDATIGYLDLMVNKATLVTGAEYSKKQKEVYKFQRDQIKAAIEKKPKEAPSEDTITRIIAELGAKDENLPEDHACAL
ncbi:hypothetical protein QBC35DRAFT_535372 [Podospora australis]|uniref:Uncharacterized protein n=1 Tax=Podospora australis TaxID=1536484 RepID=A0AAN6WL46_9PEZI|nr:hypothetical protein QBC35DRAFT_535372 [Podospora australis]